MSVVSGFKFNKRLGQNFILDEVFLQSLVRELCIGKDDVVVEVGTGAGTLTRVIAGCVSRVVTYEVDRRLEQVLRAQFSGFSNIDLVFEDALRTQINEDRYIVVANIPYYITTPLVLKFISDARCTRICVLVQDDVAKRIVAKAGTSEYGALSVALQAVADCRIIKRVPRTLFTPQPSVDSAFVVIEKTGRMAGEEAALFERMLKGLFAARRKTVANGICQTFKIDRCVAVEILQEAGIDVGLRPEQISVQKFIALLRVISARKF